MTKTLTNPVMRAPATIAVGEDITAEDHLDLQHAINFSASHYGECHLNLVGEASGWDDHAGYGDVPAGSGDAVAALGIVATGAAVIEVLTDCWIDAEHAAGEAECAVEGVVEAGNTMRAVFAVTGGLGVATATIDCTDADNGDEVMGNLDLSAATAGNERVTLTISIQRIAGAGTANRPRSLRFEELPLTTLPDPSDD